MELFCNRNNISRLSSTIYSKLIGIITSLVMPPSDYGSTNPTSMIVEHHPLDNYRVGISMLSQHTSISDSPQKKTETDDCSCDTDTKMKRSLHFHDTTSILWIERNENMSDKEVDACYYNSRDYSCFRDRERRISRTFSNWSFVKGEQRKGDYLGVESRLQRYHRRQRSKNAVFAVILEQELRQENRHEVDSSLPVEDDLAIALVYQQQTKESARLARERANVNASQVGITASSMLHNSRKSMNEIIMEKGEEETHIATTHFELPWEVPGSNEKRTTESRRTDMIKYTTCSHPILPSHYLETLHCKEPDTLWIQSQDFRYERQLKFQDQGTHYGKISQEAPVQQTYILTNEVYKSRQAMSQAHTEFQLSQLRAATEQNYSGGTITQQWMWNPIPCDVVTPTSVPRFLPWTVY
jgi:hypothetical protein